MLSHGVCDLMSQYDGERIIAGSHREQAFIYHNLSARHAEGIHTVVLNEVEFPGIVLQIIGVSVLLEISFHGSSQSLSYSYHLRSLRCIGRFLCRSHVLGIFLIRQAQHLCI